MNGQFSIKINEPEKEIKLLKSKVKKEGKKNKKTSLLIGLWKDLKVTDKELAGIKKEPLDFDIEKYLI